MKRIPEISYKRIFYVLGISIYLVFLIIYLNANYPFVGHDYAYFFPRLIDSLVHYKANGLSIQWFTPTFGGGLPAFHNPQHTQFSITQIFVFLFNPWVSTLLSISFISMVGYYYCNKFIREFLDFNWQVSILGSILFLSTGFYFQHLAVGHLTFILFPILSMIFYYIFSRKSNVWVKGSVVGLMFAVILFSGGIHLLIIFFFSFLIMFPLLSLFYKKQIDNLSVLVTVIIGFLIALIVSSGKLYAIYNFMKLFPRDFYELPFRQDSYLSSILSFLFQFVGVPLLAIPLRILADESMSISYAMRLIVNRNFGLWELDISLSLVHLYVLYNSLKDIARKTKNKWLNHREGFISRLPLILFLILSIWMTFEFSTGYGVIYNAIQEFPIIRSLTVNTRYAAAFLFPMTIISLPYINKLIQKGKKNFVIIFSCALASLLIYSFIPSEFQVRNFDLSKSNQAYEYVMEGEAVYVDQVAQVEDIETFEINSSSLYTYEAIFGYQSEEFNTQLIEGDVFTLDEGYYNFTDPRSLVYEPGDTFRRFSLDDEQVLSQFVNYEQPEWSIPKTQLLLNQIGAIVLFATLVFLAVNVVKLRLNDRS